MQKIKIIHILSHEPPENHLKFDDPLQLNEFTPIEYINFPESIKPLYFFKGDHHIIAGQELLKLTNEYDIECWRPYNSEIKQVCSKTIEGITHRIFPAKLLSIKHFGKFLWSEDMYQYITKMVDEKERFLLNIGVGHAWFHIWLMLKLRHIKNLFPIVCLHRSGGFRAFEFKNLPAWKKLYRFHYLIESVLDLYSLKYSDQNYSGSRIEAQFLEHKKGINSSFFMEGIDFKDFNSVNDKIQIRMELGLPLHKKIMIVTGNFRSSDYGYQHLIKSFAQIREKADDLALVMIGGYKHEDLYEVGLKSGAIMVERKPKEILRKYLQACDFYGQPSFHYGFINFGGFGSAMIEALACGLPVISNNIIHFPGTDSERAKIGLAHPTHNDLTEAMLYMKDNFQNYTECRTLAKKYFDINDTRYVLLNKYKELIRKYYSL